MAFYIPARFDGNDIKMRRVGKAESAISRAFEYIGLDLEETWSLGLKQIGALALASSLLPAAIGANMWANDTLRMGMDYECAASGYEGLSASNHKVALAHSEVRRGYFPEPSEFQKTWSTAITPIRWIADLTAALLITPGTETAVHYHNKEFHTDSKNEIELVE